jgi:hypothetical protein
MGSSRSRERRERREPWGKAEHRKNSAIFRNPERVTGGIPSSGRLADKQTSWFLQLKDRYILNNVLAVSVTLPGFERTKRSVLTQGSLRSRLGLPPAALRAGDSCTTGTEAIRQDDVEVRIVNGVVRGSPCLPAAGSSRPSLPVGAPHACRRSRCLHYTTDRPGPRSEIPDLTLRIFVPRSQI